MKEIKLSEHFELHYDVTSLEIGVKIVRVLYDAGFSSGLRYDHRADQKKAYTVIAIVTSNTCARAHNIIRFIDPS